MRFVAALCATFAASAAMADTILSARYIEPTTRYDHGILGDAVEWGGIEIVTGASRGDPAKTLLSTKREFTWQIVLPEDRVFEDVEPRLWDVTGDGAPELVLVLTRLDLGASLLVVGLVDGKPAEIAATPHIGATHRWLAPIGAADLDGDGFVEIAYVDRPHLARTIRVWRFRDGALGHVADLPGYTNHRIGEDNIAGGIRDCGQGPEMIVANAGWTEVAAVTFDGQRFAARSLGPHRSRASFATALACK